MLEVARLRGSTSGVLASRAPGERPGPMVSASLVVMEENGVLVVGSRGEESLLGS